MDEIVFWRLIGLCKGDGKTNSSTDVSALTEHLKTLSANDIKAFFNQLVKAVYEIDTRAHFRAMRWKSFGLGESDSFLYARLAVVGRGKAFYDTVKNNPRKMPGVLTHGLEGLLYVAPSAYEAVTGTEMKRYEGLNFETGGNVAAWVKS